MDNKGLLFIPDISGFTQFVNKTDIEHSSLIIRELLEVLINANETGLQVSEIEGDAILFYRFGETPGLDVLYKQVQRMFCDFHKRLINYDQHKFCQCNACLSAVGLSLKIITHYGEFTGYNVREFNKLIGKDVIVAHQLLKNDIDQHEYWLVTDNLLPDHNPEDLAGWMNWQHSAKRTESGEISFYYTQLGKLREDLQPDPPLKLELGDKTKVFSISRDFHEDIIRLFHATGDFRYRSLWQDGVKSVEELTHFLPRVGMRYRRIMTNGSDVVFASSYEFDEEKIKFSETDEKKRYATYYTLEYLGSGNVKLTMDYYQPKKIGGRLLFDLFEKNKLKKQAERSLANLEKIVKDIRLPSE